MSGAPTNRPASDVLDLDALLAGRSLAPKPVKFRGHVYHARRDLSAAEVARWHSLAERNRDVDAMRIIVGDEAEQLDQAMLEIPQALCTALVHEFLKATGCFDGLLSGSGLEDQAGESSASSSESSDQTGTPPSPTSVASTGSTSARSSSAGRSRTSSRSGKASGTTGARTRRTPRDS